MNKIDLEVKIESLRTMVQESQQSASNYTGQLAEMEKQLADLDKPKVTSLFLDTINEVITEAVEGLELDDGITCDFEIDYGIDYDGKVYCENHDFQNSGDLVESICEKVSLLFKEVEEESTAEGDNS